MMSCSLPDSATAAARGAGCVLRPCHRAVHVQQLQHRAKPKDFCFCSVFSHRATRAQKAAAAGMMDVARNNLGLAPRFATLHRVMISVCA